MYYPKSQIIPNLSTNGDEFNTSGGDPYKGKYYKTSDGKFFSGANPNDKPNNQLFQKTPSNLTLNSITTPVPKSQDKFLPSQESEPFSSNMYIIDSGYYKSKPELWDRKDAPRPPRYSKPLPTSKDYENGYFDRFYVRKSNEYKYIEVSNKEYQLFLEKTKEVQYNLYFPFKMLWKLKGNKTEVYEVNKKTVIEKENKLKLPGLLNYFKKRFNKYWVE